MNGKTCKECGTVKSLDSFYKDKTMSDGLWSKCKCCAKHNANTIPMLVKRIIRSQTSSSKRRGHPVPNYNAKELEDWLIKQPNFNDLYSDWKAKGYPKMLSPSIDRLNDTEPYSLTNIQLMTWQENKNKWHLKLRTSEAHKIQRKVRCLTLEGESVCVYNSGAQAARDIGGTPSPITQYCKGNKPQYKGYRWEYA